MKSGKEALNLPKLFIPYIFESRPYSPGILNCFQTCICVLLYHSFFSFRFFMYNYWHRHHLPVLFILTRKMELYLLRKQQLSFFTHQRQVLLPTTFICGPAILRQPNLLPPWQPELTHIMQRACLPALPTIGM